MPSDIATMNNTIKALTARYENLRQMSIQDRPDSEISAILDQMVLLNRDITQFEDLRNHLAASQITVADPTPDDVAAIQDAMGTLSTAIAADQKWSAAYKLTRSILDAADKIEGNIRTRQGQA